MEDLKIWSEIIQNFAVASAVAVGGIWTLSTFVFQRSHETALKLEMTTTQARCDGVSYLVFFEVALTNLSRRMIEAQAKSYDAGGAKPVYKDLEEQLSHACSLQIRRIKTRIPNETSLDWFEKAAHLEPVGVEINMISDYEISRTGEIDFWIEPGESYHLGRTIVLPPGNYLAMLTLVGTDSQHVWREERTPILETLVLYRGASGRYHRLEKCRLTFGETILSWHGSAIAPGSPRCLSSTWRFRRCPAFARDSPNKTVRAPQNS
jgi:hypothetical protein